MRPARREALALLAAAALIGPGGAEGAERVETPLGRLRLERFPARFAFPVALAFLGRGRVLVAEKAGRVRLWRPDAGAATLGGLPDVFGRKAGGIFDLALDLSRRTPWLLISYARPYAFTESRNVVIRAALDTGSEALSDRMTVFQQADAHELAGLYGGRLALSADGLLHIALGNRGDADGSVDPGRSEGKVIRLRADGSVPLDGPVAGNADVKGLWSLGHRDPGALALDPGTGRLWLIDRGWQKGERLDRILPGLAYGWPREVQPGQPAPPKGPDRVPPLRVWPAAEAPTAIAAATGPILSPWAGDLLAATDGGRSLSRLPSAGTGVSPPLLSPGDFDGRIADLRVAEDGSIWFLTGGAEGQMHRLSRAA